MRGHLCRSSEDSLDQALHQYRPTDPLLDKSIKPQNRSTQVSSTIIRPLTPNIYLHEETTRATILGPNQLIDQFVAPSNTDTVITDINNPFSSMPSIELQESSLEFKIRNQNPIKSLISRIKNIFSSKKEPQFRTITIPVSGKAHYPPNSIKNQKYNPLSFLPLILYEQFRYFYNFYFLLISLTQIYPEFVVGYLVQYIGPLLFVLTITISKEAYDDFKRFIRDREVNSQIYKKVTPNGLSDVPSSDLHVGDIIYLEKDQRVPADLVLLKTLEKQGAVFIRTDQLDGETDWKLRLASQLTQNNSYEQFFDPGLTIQAEPPHDDIHSFVGSIETPNSSKKPLTTENMLWMNTVLASGNAYGLVLYTGRDTRAMMNTSKPRMKIGKLDLEVNLLAKVLFILSIAMAFVMIALKRFFGPWLVYLIRFFILFSGIIPLSLKVNLDMARLLYSYLIMKDSDHLPDTIVRNSSIPEELGRIGFLLSDKTGTLTQNDMELKKIHLGTVCFGADSTDEVIRHIQSQHRQSSPEHTRKHSNIEGAHLLKRGRRDISSRIYNIVRALALCHNVTPSVEFENVSYQASSPDEIAIVKWTESVGIILVSRDSETIKLKYASTGEIVSFSILQIFPFTSASKRMGILVQDNVTGEIWFYLKGADVVMNDIVQRNDWLQEECDNMAREGLRTLVIGRKRLTEEALEDFMTKYEQSKVSMTERDENMKKVVSTMLEHDLELLGITGVEDRLQDDVRVTLELLRNAGIKMWMITGDKVETATCIAISSRLVGRNQSIFQVQKLTDRSQGLAALQAIQGRVDHALVIDGVSLELMLDQFPKQFLDIASDLPSVICCRCTPTQKADITRLIKPYAAGKRVCAIGDGGNDVSMIQEAHVGIGIVGKEGKQASLAADFSIVQFSHISRLLMWHGRNSYKRSAKLGQFVVHRGFVLTAIQAVFSAIFYFAPIALYQGIIAAGYCTVYTMFPVFSLAWDKDITEYTAMMYPELYKELTKGRILSMRTFFTWVLVSVYQGGVIMLMAIWLFESEFIHIVAITFTALLLNELLMVALQINTWHYIMIISEFASVSIYIASVWILRESFDPVFVTSGTFYWKVACITLVSFFPLLLLKLIGRLANPPNYTKLSE